MPQTRSFMDLCQLSSGQASALHVACIVVARHVVAMPSVTIETRTMILTTVKVLLLMEEVTHNVDSPCSQLKLLL